MSLKRLVGVTFEEPKTYDEAMELRSRLISEVDEIQGTLAVRKDLEWRNSALRSLRDKREQLRSVKDWIRRNDPRKQSEWELLSRTYALLEALAPVAVGHAEEIEALLDAIELVVPGKYLGKAGT